MDDEIITTEPKEIILGDRDPADDIPESGEPF